MGPGNRGRKNAQGDKFTRPKAQAPGPQAYDYKKIADQSYYIN